MIPYFMLLFIPLLFQTVLITNGKEVYIGNKKLTDGNIVAMPLFFIIFLMLLVLRHESIGRDLSNYKYFFNEIGRSDVFSYSGISEPIYKIYNWLVYNYISTNYQVFLAITAVLSVVPIAFVYNRDKSQGYLKAAIFVNMSTFIMLFSGLRQGLAMAIGMLAYLALTKKKILRFFIFAFIASLTHHTGFMVFFFLPLYYFRFKKKDLFWILPSIALVLIFNDKIFDFLSKKLGEANDKYITVLGSTGALGSFLLFGLFSVFFYIIGDEDRMDDEAFALRNILLFATVLQSFASLNPLAMRMNYYYILLIPIAVGTSINCRSEKYKQVAKSGGIVVSVFFTLLFFINIYNSYITGVSSLDTVPYIPFWKG